MSLSRRDLIRIASLGSLGILGSSALARSGRWFQEEFQRFDGQDVFERIVTKAGAEDWVKLPIGELIGKIAQELKGTPYVGYTLEVSKDLEYCVVNLKGLDCVTFFEDSLCMARMLKRGRNSPDDMLSEVRFTRYRHGQMSGYITRLHYTTDWFFDNEEKGVIKNITPDLPGAEPFTQQVGYMSEHPEHYRQLETHPNYVTDIKLAEAAINGRSMKYLPMEKLEAAEHLLQTGDIVGVTTTEEGIDIAHTGLCLKDDEGVVHFMDASSMPQQHFVTIEPQISKCLNWSSRLTGVMIARPLEVK